MVRLTCNNCLESREKKIIQALNDLIEIQSIIAEEIKTIHGNQELPEITDKEKGKVVNIVKRHKTASETLMDSVELYKIYRIRIILEVIKLIIIIFFIFYLLKTTQGVKTMTFISTILYIIVTLLDVFYSNYGLIIFSVLSFIIFVISAIININDITINYQNIANKTADTLSNISTEFKKDVNIL
jgi:phosphoglycerol transferase MdoB-like AlkP superfamily enzyme